MFDNNEKKDKWYGHKPAENIKTDLGDEIFDTYLKFCVIRNPYDIMVSSYFWNNKLNKEPSETFKEYAKKKNVSNLCLHSINDKIVCDYFIRYENLIEDITKLCEILNIDNYDINNLPKHKSEYRVKDVHYRDYYDEETRKIVYENHKKEFELFGYEF